MPIALNMLLDDEAYQSKKFVGKKIILTFRIIYYVLVVAWCIASILIHKIVFRLSICLLQTVITSIFVWSLFKIKKELKRLESNAQNEILQNKFII